MLLEYILIDASSGLCRYRWRRGGERVGVALDRGSVLIQIRREDE